jgi:hypothetical protein
MDMVRLDRVSNGMDSREALVALNLIEGVGPIRVRQLLNILEKHRRFSGRRGIR